MSKVLLDGYGVTLKAIRGIPDSSCPDNRDSGFYEIIVETDKGDFIIKGCSNCYVLSCDFKESEFEVKGEKE